MNKHPQHTLLLDSDPQVINIQLVETKVERITAEYKLKITTKSD